MSPAGALAVVQSPGSGAATQRGAALLFAVIPVLLLAACSAPSSSDVELETTTSESIATVDASTTVIPLETRPGGLVGPPVVSSSTPNDADPDLLVGAEPGDGVVRNEELPELVIPFGENTIVNGSAESYAKFMAEDETLVLFRWTETVGNDDLRRCFSVVSEFDGTGSCDRSDLPSGTAYNSLLFEQSGNRYYLVFGLTGDITAVDIVVDGFVGRSEVVDGVAMPAIPVELAGDVKIVANRSDGRAVAVPTL